jgi:hypothetical protein
VKLSCLGRISSYLPIFIGQELFDIPSGEYVFRSFFKV